MLKKRNYFRGLEGRGMPALTQACGASSRPEINHGWAIS
jgi:hypothetical protein